MDLHNFLRSRRSIRRFEPIPVATNVLIRVIETATYAPSAHNREPWRFVVVTREHQKSQLADMLAIDFHRDLEGDGIDQKEIEKRIRISKTRINNSPVVIMLCMDESEMDVYNDLNGTRAVAEHIMAIQSVAAAGLLLQLAACAEGLDSVWTCSPLFAANTVKLTLNLPDTWQPQAMFFMGYSVEKPKAKSLKNLNEVVKFL